MSELTVNSPCVLIGNVTKITKNEKDGKIYHKVMIEYLVERGPDQTVAASREFFCGDYYKGTCAQITTGAKIAVSFNATSRERNGFINPQDDVRTIKILEHGPAAEPTSAPASDGLNYKNAPAPAPAEDEALF